MACDLTIAVCAHNAEGRLPRCLGAIAAMRTAPERSWECIVIDNASTDRTAAIAVELGKQSGLNVRVVTEPAAGLIHARKRAAREANGEILSFVDDDNLVSPDWAECCIAFFRSHPNAGIIGGKIEPVFEDSSSAPADFKERFADALAIRDLGDAELKLSPPNNDPPCGAGMTGRTIVFRKILLEVGCFLTGHNGTALSSGEDTEIGLLAQKLGWETWYAPQLRMGHILPAHRLRQEYLDRLIVDGARAAPRLDVLRGREKQRGRVGLWLASTKWEMMAARMRLVAAIKGNKHPDAKRFPFWIGLYRSRAAGYRDLAGAKDLK
jgi:glycosyltransferase involved in cell wall biosynthesis